MISVMRAMRLFLIFLLRTHLLDVRVVVPIQSSVVRLVTIPRKAFITVLSVVWMGSSLLGRISLIQRIRRIIYTCSF
jgi:hypothetical protein